jgi:hypothetical protein
MYTFSPKILNVLVENIKELFKGIICDRCGVEVTEKKST